MRRKNILGWFAVAFAVVLFSGVSFGQYAYRIIPVAALPATCNPLNGDVRYLTAGTGSPGLYQCIAVNTWGPVGVAGNTQQLLSQQGILTGSFPYINHTATWNNGAVTFVDHFVNVTDTASAAGSLLMELQVGGVDKFKISKGGSATALDVTISAAGYYSLTGRAKLGSNADGFAYLSDSTISTFYGFILGPPNPIFPMLKVAPSIAGKTQGVVITGGDGVDPVFANLGASANGPILYCSDCTIANPCAGGGTALAAHLPSREP